MSSATATLAPAVAVARPAEVVTSAPAGDAVRLIERVVEATGNLSSRPSGPVSLSIQLDDTHRVDVRVALHDGKVHASFRSDSSEVRAALSAAWQDFARSPERAGQNWAEPVFGAAGAPASPPASESRAETGFAGHGHDQSSRRHSPDSRGETLAGGPVRPSGLTAPSSVPSTSSVSRAETSRHLSVVA